MSGLVDESPPARAGMRHAFESSEICGSIPAPVALEDNISFYFETYHVGRWHKPDHIDLCRSIGSYCLFMGRRPVKQYSNWMGKCQEYRICVLYFSPWRKESLSASQTHCIVTVHLRENFSFSPDSSFVNINFYCLSALVFQELCKCKH